jgi:predicted transposase YdaD
VVRVWQLPVAQVLTGGVGTLPLAPLCDLGALDLPGVLARMQRRLAEAGERERASDIWAATYILLGLRFSSEMAQRLIQEVRSMKESTTYQQILAEGRAEGSIEEARHMVLRVGRKLLGEPDAETERALQAITDLQRLEELGERLPDVKTWPELLGQAPAPRGRRKGRR